MKYDLTRLNSNIESSVIIKLNYEFDKEQIKGTDLISLNSNIEGSITKNSMNNLHLNVSVEGIMVLPCAITLKPTDYHYQIEIDDDIENLLDDYSYANEIDIYPIIWESIMMEIPMRVVSDEAKDYCASGDGWSFKTDEEKKSSPFDELKDLL